MWWWLDVQRVVQCLATVLTILVAVSCSSDCPHACSCLGSVIDCSKRQLLHLPVVIPNWVHTLDVSSNNIESVREETFRTLQQLQEINLSDNQLKSVNLSVFHPTYSHLTTLKINNNKLRQVISAGTQTRITHLQLANNELQDIHQVALQSMTSLRVIDLSKNHLTTLDNSSLLQLTQLETLCLDSNEVAVIEPGTFDDLIKLESLKLNKNKLRRLQKNIFTPSLRRLKHLEIERNRLQVLQGLAFHGLESLVSLKLKRNVISELMDGAFWGLTNIRTLDLTYNNITFVNRRWLYGLTSLQQLLLAHNKISKIDAESWSFCQLLTELDLRHNRLSAVSDKMFESLTYLQHLNLANNHIDYIADNGFNGLTTLHTLDLSANGISSTIETLDSCVFDEVKSLRRLLLARNKIRSVSRRVFHLLTQLTHLDLSYNEITSIQESAFNSLTLLTHFHLNTSSLLCDCHLSWFIRWLQMSQQFLTTVEARCGFPETLAAASLPQLNAISLICVDHMMPAVTHDPTPQRVLRYSNVTLQCEVASSNKETLTVVWKKDHQVVPETNIVNVVLPTTDSNVLHLRSQLHIFPVTDVHVGRYQCVASNALGVAYSRHASLTVNVLPTFIKTPIDVTVRAGSTARLDCAAVGVPTPEIALHKDGGIDFPAARERRMHIFPSDEMFFIVDVKSDDQGIYTCTARNEAGVINANATLLVLEGPSFARPMDNKLSVVGDTTVLECMSSGSPRPSLTWLKDGVHLRPTLRHFFTADDQLLVIVHTELADAGNYTCIMTNTLGSDRQISRLTVNFASDNKISTTATAATPSDDIATTTGIIITVLVTCVVFTSFIWVAVIYRTRYHRRTATQRCHHSNCHHSSAAMSTSSVSDGSAQRLLASLQMDSSVANLMYLYRDDGCYNQLCPVHSQSSNYPLDSCCLLTSTQHHLIPDWSSGKVAYSSLGDNSSLLAANQRSVTSPTPSPHQSVTPPMSHNSTPQQSVTPRTQHFHTFQDNRQKSFIEHLESDCQRDPDKHCDTVTTVDGSKQLQNCCNTRKCNSLSRQHCQSLSVLPTTELLPSDVRQHYQSLSVLPTDTRQQQIYISTMNYSKVHVADCTV